MKTGRLFNTAMFILLIPVLFVLEGSAHGASGGQNTYADYAEVVADGYAMRPTVDAWMVLPSGVSIYTVGRLKDPSEWMVLLERPSLKMSNPAPTVRELTKNVDDISRIEIGSIDLGAGSTVVAVSAILYEPTDDQDPFVRTQIFLVKGADATKVFEKDVFAPPRFLVRPTGEVVFEDVAPGCEARSPNRKMRCDRKATYSIGVRVEK